MRELVERIDRLAAAASELPWDPGVSGGCLVTQGRCANPGAGDEGIREYYGGLLICESIARPDREFVAELVNAWPRIRAALLGEAQP